MTQFASPLSRRASGKQGRSQTMHLSAVVAEAVVNASRWLRNVLTRFSPAPDFVLIDIAGRLPELRTRPQGWRGWLQRRL